MERIKIIDDWLETAQLICTKTDGKTKYNFSKFAFPIKFASKIYGHDLTLQKARDNQQDLQILINNLNNNYNPISQLKIKEKDDALKSEKRLIVIRERINNAFKKGILTQMDFKQKKKQVKTQMKIQMKIQMKKQILQSYLNQKVKNLLQKQEINQEKV